MDGQEFAQTLLTRTEGPRLPELTEAILTTIEECMWEMPDRRLTWCQMKGRGDCFHYSEIINGIQSLVHVITFSPMHNCGRIVKMVIPLT